MRRIALGISLALLVASSASAEKKAPNPMVVMETSLGTVEMELFAKEAPLSTANFLQYVKDKFYDGTIFHRVIKGFMIQGGGFTADMKQKPTRPAIKNEAGNGQRNKRGTLAMARTGVVDSATAQFFVNVVDNDFLDHTSNDPSGFGYAVFGKVTKGMDVVDKIREVATGRCGPMPDCPQTPVVIKGMKVK